MMNSLLVVRWCFVAIVVLACATDRAAAGSSSKVVRFGFCKKPKTQSDFNATAVGIIV
jgi:hypothetical protein